mgnify:CR=1 FL=1
MRQPAGKDSGEEEREGEKQSRKGCGLKAKEEESYGSALHLSLASREGSWEEGSGGGLSTPRKSKENAIGRKGAQSRECVMPSMRASFLGCGWGDWEGRRERKNGQSRGRRFQNMRRRDVGPAKEDQARCRPCCCVESAPPVCPVHAHARPRSSPFLREAHRMAPRRAPVRCLIFPLQPQGASPIHLR